MGLVIQRIEPNGRVYRDGRLKTDDRIVEINGRSLLDLDFNRAQEVLRDAIKESSESGELEFAVVRAPLAAPASPPVAEPEEVSEWEAAGANERPIEAHEDKENDAQGPSYHSNSINMAALNTKRLGKKITVQLVKGPQGLGFKLAARDNCNSGEFSPIYIKNILPKGAAITDGRLQRGDRLLEVNTIDMTRKTLHEAVNMLRNTKLGSSVEIIVSRQVPFNSSAKTTESEAIATLPRQMDEAQDESGAESGRLLLTFEIALNDTGSAGLGVSVKGKTKRIEENDCSIDLGIFVKTVINGGAASKDGRLRPNDQLININGFSLLGKSNEEAMMILREAMQVESRPGHIQLTVSRKSKPTVTKADESKQSSVKSVEDEVKASSISPVVKVVHHGNSSPYKSNAQSVAKDEAPNRFARDAPNRRSMSEKRVKIGNAAPPIAHSQTSHAISTIKYQRGQALIDTNPKRLESLKAKKGRATYTRAESHSAAADSYHSSKSIWKGEKGFEFVSRNLEI